MRRPAGTPVVLAYVAFALIGIGAGVTGVVLAAQLDDYAVDKATIGITFFTSSAGFVVAGMTAGALIQRFGFRIALAVGGSGLVLAGLYTATHPPFAAFAASQVLVGYATGVLESTLNAYLAALPNATSLLGRLHAFFGVGALLGPPLATWIVNRTSWTVVLLVVGLAYVPVVAGFLVAFPRGGGPGAVRQESASQSVPGGGLLRTALRQHGVLLGAALLAVYVGLELGVGNWAFSYLVHARDQGETLAGYSVSGYWLGLTMGRFLISPVATRLGATTAELMYGCLAGVMAAAALAWLMPAAVAVSAAFVLLGFFLGPIFPTTMAVVPRLTSARLVPTAIGVMNAGSVVGGSALPWLAGAIAQGAGLWTLLPFAMTLTLVLLAIWRPIAHRLRPGYGPDEDPSVAVPAG